MQIGEVIRKYRKEKHLTQEQMADRLGVSTPAVNKWENGNSIPDVMLLAPIARLLGITTDTLLAYKDNLTPSEIKSLIHEAETKYKTEPIEEVFAWVKGKIEEYPNCEMLIYQLSVQLNARCTLSDVYENHENHQPLTEVTKRSITNFVTDCYTRLLSSEEETMRYIGASVLFYQYFQQEEYEKAQDCLSYFSDHDPEKKRRQATIYAKTGKIPEAYRIYEEILLSAYGRLSLSLHGLFNLAMSEGDREKAAFLADKQEEMHNLFDQEDYQSNSMRLELATADQDADLTFDLVKKILDGLPEQINNYFQSSLYAHIERKEAASDNTEFADFWQSYKRSLAAKFRTDAAFAFLAGNPQWEELLQENQA
jgi:transcriptional regulator with XRE-family HTH domain